MGLDTVEILMQWEEAFDIQISDKEAALLRTPKNAIDLVCAKLNVANRLGGGCLGLRAFHQLRGAIVDNTEIPRGSIKPRARLNDLIGQNRRKIWTSVCATRGWKRLTNPVYLVGLGFFNTTIEDVTNSLIAQNARSLLKPGEPWSRHHIRSVVRASVTELVGVRDFSDDDHFIRDIGMG